MKCLNTIKTNGRIFNCGKCINCRINYTQMWSMRLIYELSTQKCASFITLTYNNNNLPKDFGLQKKDLIDFWKRLRINLKREYHEFAPKIKYYACGEYGDNEKIYLSPGATKCHGRPHYHAIVFGLNDLDDKHRDILKKSWTLCESWLFDKERGKNSGMQEVTPDDINYVTGYVQKKLSGNLGKEYYGDCQPPFSVCSSGLGLEFAEKNKERLLNNGWTYFKGHKVSIPKYFCDKWNVKRSDLLPELSLSQLKNNYIEYEKDFDLMFEEFQQDMIRKHVWRDDTDINKDRLMQIRLQKWLEDRQFEYSERIFNDFLERRKLLGGKI